MLKLKKLQVLGFKSFCDRTELKFHGDGIAAIVGPNGCGKSNIADAISWVLGEQSAKSLRGSRMEDVIFIGTRDRKPTGMAEVSLTLVDPDTYDGAVPEEPEIEVSNEGSDDWDEAAMREAALADTERLIEEVQPLGSEEVVVSSGGAGLQSGNSASETTAALAPEAAEAEMPQVRPQSLEANVGPEEEEGAGGATGEHVVLRIRRRKLKPMQLRKGEIVVTRRLFRSGESEYLLNGKICRLRDIQDIFMGTGLGPESYAIIEQGRIGQILSSRPHERRAILEEAAGITKFKTKKRLAEARLEQAQLNLARVNDIFDEVTRQMNSLKRQASKAERYVRLRDEMRARLRGVLASKFTQLENEAKNLQAELERIAEQVRLRQEETQRLEAAQTEATRRGYAVEDESKKNTELLNNIVLEIDRGTARRRNNLERCTELDVRAAALDAETARTREQLLSLETELNSNRAVLASAQADVEGAHCEAQIRQQEAASLTQKLTQLEQQQEGGRRESLEVVGKLAAVHNEIGKAEEHLASLERDGKRLVNEMSTANQQAEACGGRRGQAAFEFESVTQRINVLTTQIAETRQAIESKRAQETESKAHLDSLRAEYAAALGKKSSLEAMIAEHGYSTESVKRLFQSGAIEKGFAPVGVLADFLEVDDQYESVVEDFLRDELNYVVVKSWDAADEGLRMLRSDVDGRATFLVHPEDAQAKFSFVFDETRRPARQPGSIVPVKSCIRVLNGFGKSLEVILPKLGNGYLAPDPKIAKEMALENPNAFFLSPAGECFHNVTVTGGKQRSEGPLSMKRDLREVMRISSELERALRNEEGRMLLLGREIKELQARLENLETEKRDAERVALTSGHALEQLDAQLERARQQFGVAEKEAERLRAEHRGTEQSIATLREQAEQQEQHKQTLEQQLAGAQASLAELRVQREQAAQLASQAQARVAGLEERRIAAAAALDRIESLAGEVNSRLTGIRGQMEAAAAEKNQRQADNQALATQLLQLEAQQREARERSLALQAESEAVRASIAALEQDVRDLRHALDAWRDRRGEISTAAAKLTSDLEHMAENCRNDLGISREELLADITVLRFQGEQLAQEEALYQEMKARLEGMGPVNMMALEEYNETAQRHAFLESQRKDLLESITNTQSTIREIDVISRQKFEEAFARINENFQQTFRKLFGGGQAFMRLTDEENSAESGIDVIASPPGKKLQNVLLLSGGEKALTALALLVGIFQYQPSPFCILDEVDAPLDEANVRRFTEMVREMAKQTQFVLITHNKRTMEAAPVMYGVTMQEPGVSKIVSVKFGEHAVPG
ncbi:MAG: chromosome segregation protein SMC [Acidobacteriales bacterium]|nr:chromosome segregation protein SMC [Terriglobales bacterium]